MAACMHARASRSDLVKIAQKEYAQQRLDAGYGQVTGA
jgi:hypothetical protein